MISSALFLTRVLCTPARGCTTGSFVRPVRETAPREIFGAFGRIDARDQIPYAYLL